uniref:Uncharacterized protein n=1 Tax=Sinocyclocheilus grahami TaxID=75366 RepID=A0A672MII9_SINGR
MPWFHARVSGMELQVQTRWTSLLFLLGLLWLLWSAQANVLESLLQRNSGKLAAGGGKESSGSATPLIPERMLLCHCYHHCPEDSTNNTCRYTHTHYYYYYRSGFRGHIVCSFTQCSS